MDNYTDMPDNKFKNIKIHIVPYFNGATPESMACYLVVSGLDKSLMKNKGNTALDLGNFIYRKTGFIYHPTPEFNKHGEPKNSCSFYMTQKTFFSDKNKHILDYLQKRQPSAVIRPNLNHANFSRIEVFL